MASSASETGRGRLPRIGLPTYVETASWGPWHERAALLPHTYVEAVVGAGAIPVLLAPVDLPGAVEAIVDGLDGLLLTGGADVDPARYGAEPGPATDKPRTDRDAFDQALLAAALERDLPVLAVCRGLQVLDVALGGTLHQHVPDVAGHDGHRPVPGTWGTTQVKLQEGSRLAAILGDQVEVLCHHHQAIDRLGTGLDVTASAEDGMIEGVELRDHSFVVGVQWHPEQMGDLRLFTALIEEASR